MADEESNQLTFRIERIENNNSISNNIFQRDKDEQSPNQDAEISVEEVKKQNTETPAIHSP
jgi:hypothetical protein